MNAVVNFEEEKELAEKKQPNIYQRLNAVMAEVDYIQKSDKRVNNQYRFVSHDQVVGVLHKPLTKHGIAVIPSILEHSQAGTATTVKIQVSFINIDEPTDRIDTIHFGYGIDGGDKGIGKAISYAVKYALLKTFCLETGDDPDDTPNVTLESAEGDSLTFGEIEEFLKTTERNVTDGFSYIASLAADGKNTTGQIAGRSMKNKDGFIKNLDAWIKKGKPLI